MNYPGGGGRVGVRRCAGTKAFLHGFGIDKRNYPLPDGRGSDEKRQPLSHGRGSDSGHDCGRRAPSLASEAGGRERANRGGRHDGGVRRADGNLVVLLVAAATAVSALGVCISRNIVHGDLVVYGTRIGVHVVFHAGGELSWRDSVDRLLGRDTGASDFRRHADQQITVGEFECGTGEMAAAGVVCGALFGCLCSLLTRAVWGGNATGRRGSGVVRDRRAVADGVRGSV